MMPPYTNTLILHSCFLESSPVHVGTYTSTPTRYHMPSSSLSGTRDVTHDLISVHFSHVIFYTTCRHYYTNKTVVIAVVRYVYVNVVSHFLIYHSATGRYKYTNWTPDVVIVRFIIVFVVSCFKFSFIFFLAECR